MDWSALHSRLRAVPEPAWPLGASSALALVFRVWWIPVFIAALVGLSFCVQRGTRRRARRLHAEVAATGGGVWLGRMPIEEASALWGKSLPVLLAFPYFDIGYPVKLVADANGLATSADQRAQFLP